MAPRSGTHALVMGYLEKYPTLPNGKPMPKQKLARIIYAENKLSFRDSEHVRLTIQKVTGKSGKEIRSRIKDKRFYEDEERSRANPYNLPDSDETIWEPHILNGERILGLFDVHCPFHSIPALSAAIKWANPRKPDTILLAGDAIDCHHLSRFIKDPKKRRFADEINMFKDLISALRHEFPNARIVFKEGNHEERYNHFLAQKANELDGVDEFKLENIIRSRVGEMDYIGNKRIIKAGDLNIIHGHEFAGGTFSPVNIARGLFLKAKVSAMQGHNHQTSEHTETDMNGRITTTWSVGCLSELHPEYMPLNKWNHGFALIEVEKSGDFQVHNKRIHKGEVL